MSDQTGNDGSVSPSRVPPPAPDQVPGPARGPLPGVGESPVPGPTFRPSPRRSRLLPVVGGLVALVVVVLAGSGLWVRSQLNPGGPNEPVDFVIAQGATTADVAEQLAEAGVVGNATAFRAYLRVRGGASFEAGRYSGLTTNQPVDQVLDVLNAGPAPPEVARVTIPEGLWLSEIRQRVLDTFPEMTADDWDAAVATVTSRYQPPGSSLEGLLFPATYEVAIDDRADARKLVEQMVATFEAVADDIGLADATARIAAATGLDLTPYEVITLASMIESESRVETERPQVARVMYNRLNEGMRLDIDATVVYALGERTEVLTVSDLAIDSPWNTRRFGGIPPSPISAPGRTALESALNPASGPWLYYVLVDQDGNHFFTDDYDEFLAVAEDSRQRGVFQ